MKFFNLKLCSSKILAFQSSAVPLRPYWSDCNENASQGERIKVISVDLPDTMTKVAEIPKEVVGTIGRQSE